MTTKDRESGTLEVTVEKASGAKSGRRTETTKAETATVEALGPASKTPAPKAVGGYAQGVTINLGNFTSARVDVSLSMPCPPTMIDETFDFVREFVAERLAKDAAEASK